jgi:hypothetical protein
MTTMMEQIQSALEGSIDGEGSAGRLVEILEAQGLAIVPIEPTPRMREAGDVYCDGETSIDASDNARSCWLAMIAAVTLGD